MIHTLRSRGLIALAMAGTLAALPQWGLRAQDAQQTRQILEHTDQARLTAIGRQAQAAAEADRAAAIELAKATGKPLEIREAKTGNRLVLWGLSPSGHPVYVGSENLGAASTIRTDRLWNSSRAGWSLSGRGIRLGVWDGGGVRADHRELIGRVQQMDGNNTPDEHCTHVTGTIVARGVNPSARGGAYEASALVWDFNNDIGEMSNAYGQGMIISNHSYGARGGWVQSGSGWTWLGDATINSREDYQFGLYDSRAAQWDALMHASPFTLAFKAAGNSRGMGPGNPNRPNNGPYDCMTNLAVAKNSITIGAVEKINGVYQNPQSVRMSSFSSWGPTDDGRIKPDLVAVGVAVLSTSEVTTSSYSTLEGTSMAGPNAAAAGVLLQELHASLNGGRLMRASTLKAVLIHTAEEAGTTAGPDYAFGYGLINAERAAQVLAADSMSGTLVTERWLAQGDSIVIQLTRQANSGPLKATLSWTDPAGQAGGAVFNDRTPRLVNDLDVRIYNAQGVAYTPWGLNPDQPAAAATRGDNRLDNVEVVEAGNLPAGTYRLVVRHKGVLQGGGQYFGLIISGLSPQSVATCRPLQIFRATSGRVSDGSGLRPAAAGLDCRYQILADNPATNIRLDFDTLGLQAGDSVYVFAGTAAVGSPIARVSGSSLPGTLIVSGGSVTMRFVTGPGSTASQGWSVRYVFLRLPQADFAASQTMVCTGQPVTLQLDALGNDTIGWQYNWTLPGTVQAQSTQASPTVTFPVGGVYRPTLTITNLSGSVAISREVEVFVRPTPGARTNYTESFEADSFPNVAAARTNYWQIEGQLLANRTWTRSEAGPRTGSAAMRINNNNGDGIVRSLLTPTFQLAGVPGPHRLRFAWAFRARNAQPYQDRLTILYSTNCGNNWTTLISRTQQTPIPLATVTQTSTAQFIPQPDQYRLDSVTLTRPDMLSAQSIMFKFEMTSFTGGDLLLDDVSIISPNGPLSARPTLATLGLRLYPNPTLGTLELEVPAGMASANRPLECTMTDVAGRQVATGRVPVPAAGGVVDLSTLVAPLAPGVYQLQVRTPGGVNVVERVVRQ